MVNVNKGLPDPEGSERELPNLNDGDILLASDDDVDADSETEMEAFFNDYEALATEDHADSNPGSGEDEEMTEFLETSPLALNTPPEYSVPTGTPYEFDQFSFTPNDIELDSQKIDEVKQAMAGVTLPASSIPEWASKIPEDEWKQHLLTQLHRKKDDK